MKEVTDYKTYLELFEELQFEDDVDKMIIRNLFLDYMISNSPQRMQLNDLNLFIHPSSKLYLKENFDYNEDIHLLKDNFVFLLFEVGKNQPINFLENYLAKLGILLEDIHSFEYVKYSSDPNEFKVTLIYQEKRKF